jgi:hypothetical protein
MTPDEILATINTLLPIGITVGQAIGHALKGTVPPGVSPADWAALNSAALDRADATDDETLKDIADDQAQHGNN